MKEITKSLALILLVSALSSCIGVRSDKYPEVKKEELKTASTKKTKLFVEWKFQHISYPEKRFEETFKKAGDNHKEIFLNLVKESECCEIVADKTKADVAINGSFSNETGATELLVLSALSGVTFTTIPIWMDFKSRVVATAENGKLSKTYNVNDEVFFMQWAPLIFAFPFANAYKAESGANLNLYKTLLLQIKKDGFLEKNK